MYSVPIDSPDINHSNSNENTGPSNNSKSPFKLSMKEAMTLMKDSYRTPFPPSSLCDPLAPVNALFDFSSASCPIYPKDETLILNMINRLSGAQGAQNNNNINNKALHRLFLLMNEAERLSNRQLFTDKPLLACLTPLFLDSEKDSFYFVDALQRLMGDFKNESRNVELLAQLITFDQASSKLFSRVLAEISSSSSAIFAATSRPFLPSLYQALVEDHRPYAFYSSLQLFDLILTLQHEFREPNLSALVSQSKRFFFHALNSQDFTFISGECWERLRDFSHALLSFSVTSNPPGQISTSDAQIVLSVAFSVLERETKLPGGGCINVGRFQSLLNVLTLSCFTPAKHGTTEAFQKEMSVLLQRPDAPFVFKETVVGLLLALYGRMRSRQGLDFAISQLDCLDGGRISPFCVSPLIAGLAHNVRAAEAVSRLTSSANQRVVHELEREDILTLLKHLSASDDFDSAGRLLQALMRCKDPRPENLVVYLHEVVSHFDSASDNFSVLKSMFSSSPPLSSDSTQAPIQASQKDAVPLWVQLPLVSLAIKGSSSDDLMWAEKLYTQIFSSSDTLQSAPITVIAPLSDITNTLSQTLKQLSLLRNSFKHLCEVSRRHSHLLSPDIVANALAGLLQGPSSHDLWENDVMLLDLAYPLPPQTSFLPPSRSDSVAELNTTFRPVVPKKGSLQARTRAVRVRALALVAAKMAVIHSTHLAKVVTLFREDQYFSPEGIPFFINHALDYLDTVEIKASNESSASSPYKVLYETLMQHEKIGPLLSLNEHMALLRPLILHDSFETMLRCVHDARRQGVSGEGPYLLLLASAARLRLFDPALSLITQMKKESIVVKERAYVLAMRAASSPSHVPKVVALFKDMKAEGLVIGGEVYAAILTLALTTGRSGVAMPLLKDLLNDSNIAISAHDASSLYDVIKELPAIDFRLVLELDDRVRAKGGHVDGYYLSSLLQVCLARIELASSALEIRLGFPGTDALIKESDGAYGCAVKTYAELTQGLDAFLKHGYLKRSVHDMLKIAALMGDGDLALSVWEFMHKYSIKRQLGDFTHMIDACGFDGRLSSMMEAFKERESSGFATNIDILTKLIFHFGHNGDISGAMSVYDKMISLGLQPTRLLNDVLIHVCRVDLVSVLLNAEKARREKERKK